ncbi:MAG: PaaI family thioesterase [Saccharofermentans sp.]|nr:PaaI family thioesterase [Saccharofermentans sp.]
MVDIDRVRKFFEGDKYATSCTGIVIDSCSKGHSVVSLMPDERHLNAVGGMMGAVYYTLADFAFAVAENCDLESETVTVSQTASMNFLRSWEGGKVICTADIIKDGRAITVYEVKCIGEGGRELAIMTINGFKVKRR